MTKNTNGELIQNTDNSQVERIEEDHYIFASVVIERDVFEVAFHNGLPAETRGRLLYLSGQASGTFKNDQKKYHNSV